MLFFKFLTRIFIPLGLGSLGSAIFISQVLGGYSDPDSWDLIKAASNGLFLFGAAGSCMGWAIEEQLRSSMYRQFFAQLNWLAGIDVFTDEERATIVSVRDFLQTLKIKE